MDDGGLIGRVGEIDPEALAGRSVSPDLPERPISPKTRAGLPLTSRLRVVAMRRWASVAALAERNRRVPTVATAIPEVSNRRREMAVGMDRAP